MTKKEYGDIHPEALVEQKTAKESSEPPLEAESSSGIRQEGEEAERVARTELEALREHLHGEKSEEERRLVLGDFGGATIQGGQVVLSEKETCVLAEAASVFFAETKDSKVATTKGYKVAGVYDTQVQGWTTQSKIIDLDGKKVFILCSYPAGAMRRRTDRLMERLSGDPMRKPKPAEWKGIVESRSNIPTIAGMPEGIVAMPFVESINVYDIFAHQKDIKDYGPFEWAKTMSVDERLDLIGPLAEELKRVHDGGKTWGEAILPNFVLTKDRTPILVDPETTYEGIDLPEQKALDLRNLILSAYGALARAEKFTDPEAVIARVLDGYDDAAVKKSLAQLCEKPLSLRKRLFFNLFGRYRIGATDLKEFELVRGAIHAYASR